MTAVIDDQVFEKLEETLSQLDQKGLSNEMLLAIQQARELTAGIQDDVQTLVQENAELRLELEQSLQYRAAYVSIISHELRIPMTAVKGYADLLRQGVVGSMNEMQLNFVDVIRNNVERMAALVSDLSDLTKIESGRNHFTTGLFAPQAHIEKVAASLQQMITTKQQSLEIELQPDLPELQLDPGRFGQILTNFLKNACMYTPEHGKIAVRARRAEAGAALHIEVQDDGIGVRPDEQEKLFTQFFRSDEAFVREQPGWGLGLSVNQALVEALGGQVGFHSVHTEGSTFWFVLPLAPQATAPLQPSV